VPDKENLIIGGGTMVLDGIIYLPKQPLKVTGNGDIGLDAKQVAIIADSIDIEGNGQLNIRISNDYKDVARRKLRLARKDRSKQVEEQADTGKRDCCASGLGRTRGGALAGEARRQADADADRMQQGGRENKAEGVAQPGCIVRHFGAMGVPMEDREETDEPHRRDHGQPDPERHGGTKRHDRQTDAKLDEGQCDAADPDDAAGSHHRQERRRDEIQGSATQRRSVEADRHHRQDVIEPAERMGETVLESARRADAGVGLGGGGKNDQRWNDEW
jgi:hypothetical protein